MVKKIYPFESHYLELNGLNYHYLDEGEGEVVLMLHGNPTWSFYYRNLVLALRSHYRIIVPDHIGCGLSDKPAKDIYPYTLERRVSDLEALLQHLGIQDNINLVVHDWGGMIGMVYATRYPESIKRMIVMNTSAFHLPKKKKLPWQIWIVRNTPLGALLVQGLNLFALGATYFCCSRPMSRQTRKAFLAPYNSWKNRIAVLRFVQDIPLQETDPGYAMISEVEARLHLLKEKPLLIFWGEKDFVFDHHFLAQWREQFPHAQIHSYPSYGHYILEDAIEDIAPTMQRFLAHKKISNASP